MSLSTLDKIKLKTQQILVKTDDYLTTTKNGMDASHHGIMFGAASIIAGITGVMAIVAAPTLPAIAGVAALASIPTFAVGGAAVNLAGATLLGGGAASIAFTIFAKMYKSAKGETNYHVNGELECLPKGSNGDLSKIVKVNRKEVLKSIENETFSQKYEAVKIRDFHDPNGHFMLEIPNAHTLVVKGNEKYYSSTAGILDRVASEAYIEGPYLAKPAQESWAEDCKTIRRECFKEAKNADLKASIMNRINNFREKIEGAAPKKKYTV
jgi:hypothetical protein